MIPRLLLLDRHFHRQVLPPILPLRLGYTVGYLDVFLNGAKQIEGQDYDANNSSTFDILGGGVTNGDIIEAVAYKAFNVSNIKDAPGDFTVGNNLTVVGHTTAVTAVYTGVVTTSRFRW